MGDVAGPASKGPGGGGVSGGALGPGLAQGSVLYAPLLEEGQGGVGGLVDYGGVVAGVLAHLRGGGVGQSLARLHQKGTRDTRGSMWVCMVPRASGDGFGFEGPVCTRAFPCPFVSLGLTQGSPLSPSLPFDAVDPTCPYALFMAHARTHTHTHTLTHTDNTRTHTHTHARTRHRRPLRPGTWILVHWGLPTQT